MPTRSPVTLAIPVWNAWRETQACLESLRPTLGLRDQVLVVDNGSTDATATRLKLFPWVEVLHNDVNEGFGAACNRAAGLAAHELVVLVHNDTEFSKHWLDALLAPFEDAGVVAIGPRSNYVGGAQVADGASYRPTDRAAMRRFARQWALDHRGQVTEVSRLSDVCIAVRRAAFLEVGGFDPGYVDGAYLDDDLSIRLGRQGRLVVADGSFVHHHGHRTFEANRVDPRAAEAHNARHYALSWGGGAPERPPLVSACLIVKDEEHNLVRCLNSLEGFADEVVIYDTGSTDGTVALAREAGATVIEGYWDDDFSRARNAALAHCRGEWIAWLDADEALVCPDLGALRSQLTHTGPAVDAYSLPIDNESDSGVSSRFVHAACRIFRRSRCEWTGRLHEQVAGRGDHRPVDVAMLDDVRISHTGYTTEAMTSRSKAERNLRLAQAEVDRADGWDRGFSLTSLGRSYLTAGRPELALVNCRLGAQETKNPVTRRLALRTVVEALVALARPEEALAALDDLRAASDRQVLVTVLEAKVRRQLGEHDRVVELFEALDGSETDDDGFEYDGSTYALPRAESLAALGRYSEAADALLVAMEDRSVLDTHLGTLVDYLERAGRPLGTLVPALRGDNERIFFAQILQLPHDVADRVLESCLAEGADPMLALATAATLARRLGVERALVWSSRLRRHGLTGACPLLAIASDPGRPAVERARAAAAGYRIFADEELARAFHAVLGAASHDERGQIELEASALCPDLLGVCRAS